VQEVGSVGIIAARLPSDAFDSLLLEGSDKLARDAFVYSVKVFTSLVLFYASIISHNSGAPTDISVGAP